MEPLIPPAKRGGNRRHVVVREVINGLMYILSTGCQWRAIPTDLPPRSTLYDYFDLWSWDSARSHPRRALCAMPGGRLARGEPDRRDHRQPERQERGKRGLRLICRATMRARRGKKRHILVDTQGLLMHAIVHPDVQDRDGGAPLMASFSRLSVPDSSMPTAITRGRSSRARSNGFGARPRRDRQAIVKPQASSRCPNAGSSNAHSLGSAAADDWPRTGNASTTRRSPSSASPPSLSCCENYAIPHDVLGQILRSLGRQSPAWRYRLRSAFVHIPNHPPICR